MFLSSFPPSATPLPSERPVGCKTVILSEIPFKMTVDMVVDLCERVAGSVESYEMSRGPYCQVRFHDAGAIDRVFSLHGKSNVKTVFLFHLSCINSCPPLTSGWMCLSSSGRKTVCNTFHDLKSELLTHTKYVTSLVLVVPLRGTKVKLTL